MRLFEKETDQICEAKLQNLCVSLIITIYLGLNLQLTHTCVNPQMLHTNHCIRFLYLKGCGS